MLKTEVKGLKELASNLKAAPENIRTGLDALVGGISEKIRALANILIKSRTGNLARSSYVTHGGLVSYTVGYSRPYAIFVHEGTRPHDIYPRALGGVLAFQMGGATIFARHVHHPGTMPQNFLSAARTYYEPELIRGVKENIAKWIRWSNS